ncbi:PEP-CTERM sorting domain-containing protein [Accumulibacter sp.]|uniref:PEP-CTERM sorting domain-containing protein n=1 Tax=Accumulibacter sp. TaxID=2053492 RepID=UPI0028C4ABF2|nr:PEP-CTERM sorting domain-containing protein [Accumulibacter sp.]
MRILTTLMLSLAAFSAHAIDTIPGNNVPEPGTLALLGLAAVVGLVAHKRRK